MESKDVMLVKVDMLAGIVKSKGSEYISNVHYTQATHKLPCDDRLIYCLLFQPSFVF